MRASAGRRAQRAVAGQLALPLAIEDGEAACRTHAIESPPITPPRPTPDASARGRIGAFRLHAMHDSRALTQAARRAFLSGFERQVDPAGILDPAERERRALYARREHFARLARASAQSRRQRSA